ncbi:Alpha/Beta hydrolase protein [Lentinula aciculospora]|uniref:Alpha/Beta hydrolase protein n=1 Tax=Lentinula aciculospora TaxID=153920 RepID=A0A9W9ALI0_9AGAR|nr:Alpha/Beta hydrolase protein [Lentinula aciculospora]
MPFINVSTSTGTTKFHYTISTPSCDDAQMIEPELPVLLFFHAFAFHTVFHSQFSDPLLRKFNLVTFDLRYHGDTESDTVPERYGQEEAAEDAIAFINALQLPPSHFIALDLGSIIALQVAVMFPAQVLSLFIMSHVCLEELPEVQEGRTELYDLWTSGSPDAKADVAIGYTQYTFSNNVSNLAKALCDSTLPVDLRNWSAEHLQEYQLISYNIFCNRKSQPKTVLSRIHCPVKLLHGGDSVVYKSSYTEEFMKSLRNAGVDASMETIPNAPHYLCVDYGNEVNRMIHDLVDHCTPERSISPTTSPVDVRSPWDEILRQYGWEPERKNQLDDDDITVSFPTRN